MPPFRLLSVPAVAITVLIGMMVHVGNNIHGVFCLLLGEVEGISATLIGYLVALSSATAAAGSLWATSLRRRFKAYWDFVGLGIRRLDNYLHYAADFECTRKSNDWVVLGGSSKYR